MGCPCQQEVSENMNYPLGSLDQWDLIEVVRQSSGKAVSACASWRAKMCFGGNLDITNDRTFPKVPRCSLAVVEVCQELNFIEGGCSYRQAVIKNPHQACGLLWIKFSQLYICHSSNWLQHDALRCPQILLSCFDRLGAVNAETEA